jgi:hypothetical protein
MTVWSFLKLTVCLWLLRKTVKGADWLLRLVILAALWPAPSSPSWDTRWRCGGGGRRPGCAAPPPRR